MGQSGGVPDQLNVLVVDDDPAMRELLVEIVHREGHMAVPAESAEAALELLPVWTFHVAFLDHNLPGMEGLVIGEFLRRNNPDMTIAMVTGSDDLSVARKSRDLSLTFIPKPFDVADINRVMDAAIEAAKQRDSRRKAEICADYGPSFADYHEDLAECYRIPSVPSRVGNRVIEKVKRSLSNLRSASRYTERERVIALSGLLTARVLGLDLPRASAGHTLYEEYDRLMVERGRRTGRSIQFAEPGQAARFFQLHDQRPHHRHHQRGGLVGRAGRGGFHADGNPLPRRSDPGRRPRLCDGFQQQVSREDRLG